MGHPQQTYDKEKISLNIARIKKNNEIFEIILDDPKLALSLREGKKIDIRESLRSEDIFKDAKKGLLASSNEMKEIFQTEDTLKVAEKIIKEGELQLTSDIRKELYENKKRQIIDYIHMHAIDSKTKNPHPAKRIELAMEEAKIRIDPYDTIRFQIKKILPELRTIIPISIEKTKIFAIIPNKYAAKAYSVMKGKYDLSKEKWDNDGSVSFEIETQPGMKPEVLDNLNKLTNGEAEIRN